MTDKDRARLLSILGTRSPSKTHNAVSVLKRSNFIDLASSCTLSASDKAVNWTTNKTASGTDYYVRARKLDGMHSWYPISAFSAFPKILEDLKEYEREHGQKSWIPFSSALSNMEKSGSIRVTLQF